MDRRAIFRVLAVASVVTLAAGCAATGTRGEPGMDTSSDGADDSTADGFVGCTSDSDCNDLIACTIDHCEEGLCEHTPCVDCCDEGLECRPDYGCGSVPTPCDTDEDCVDEIRCTLDRCRDGEYCEHMPQNDLCEDDEICLAALGCIPEPPDDCDTDEDCWEALPCIAEWYCDPEFGCQFLSLIDCGDDDPCTEDWCDPDVGECVHDIADADDDDYTDETCGGDDCDDTDPLINPGAAERCNELDDDCDEEVDEGFECWPVGLEEDCTTSCDTTGTHECGADCAWAECIPPDEVCNGGDDDCDTEIDEDFYCAQGELDDCTTSCSSTGTRECRGDCSDWGDCIPPAEICNGVDDDCDSSADDGFFCIMGDVMDCALLGSWFAGSAVCADDCGSWNEDACTNCGNGAIDVPEQCDLGDLDGNDCTTMGLGYAGGTLDCFSDCTFDTTGCNYCGNGTIDALEDCDSLNLDGNDCTTLGLGYAGGTLACTGLCVFDTSACNRCGNSTIDAGEQCDLTNLAGNDCTTIAGGYTGGTLACSSTCDFLTTGCWTCGDGDVNTGEDCDAGNLAGNDCTTIPGGYHDGTLDCYTDCTFDETLCHHCGDGDIDTGEECDGLALGGEDCLSQGFDDGTLVCTGGCLLDDSGCWECGDGDINTGEQCDGSNLGGNDCTTIGGGYTGGTLVCRGDCTFNEDRCEVGAWTPTGTYGLDTWISYTCAYSLVNFSFGTLTFTELGATLYVDDGGSLQPCQMQGTTPGPMGSFTVTCTLPGSCDETYSLTGAFTGADTWEGTFSASFTGSCLGCTYQSWFVTGTR